MLQPRQHTSIPRHNMLLSLLQELRAYPFTSCWLIICNVLLLTTLNSPSSLTTPTHPCSPVLSLKEQYHGGTMTHVYRKEASCCMFWGCLFVLIGWLVVCCVIISSWETPHYVPSLASRMTLHFVPFLSFLRLSMLARTKPGCRPIVDLKGWSFRAKRSLQPQPLITSRPHSLPG